MYLMTCTRPDLAYPLSILARYVAPGRHRPEHMAAAKRVLRYLCSTSGMGLVLGGRRPVVLTGHADASWADDQATQRSSQGYTFSLSSGSVSWRSTRSSSVLSSSCEDEIYAGPMAAQELRWLTYLLTDLGEQPRSPSVLSEGLGFESQCVHFGHPSAGGCQRSTGDPRLILGKGYRLVVLGGHGRTDSLLNTPFYPSGLVTGILTVLYVDNKAMLALCREHRLEHRTKHIALRYFLARELQQRGQLRLAYVASEANTADIFTKALPPGDHQRFCTMLACFALLDWSCDLLFSPTVPMGAKNLLLDQAEVSSFILPEARMASPLLARVFMLLPLLAFAVPHSNAVRLIPSQENALLSLKTAWRDCPIINTWVSGADCSEWYGVGCDKRGMVTGLYISSYLSMGVACTGELTESVGKLKELTSLGVSGIWRISGSLPKSLAKLKKLESIAIDYNRYGVLSGNFPDYIVNFVHLTELVLQGTGLTGSIPSGISQLSRLTRLDLQWNRLGGEIPRELSALTALKTLELTGNRLTGSIPPTLGYLTELTSLHLGSNKLSGAFPSTVLLSMQSLEELNLQSNRFTQQASSSIAELASHQSLTNIDLSWNLLSGSVPSQLGQMKKLEYLYLTGNKLKGSVPVALIQNMPKLYDLDLSYNKLSGEFPWAAFKTAPALEFVRLQRNTFVGEIPADAFKKSHVAHFNISFNLFSGSMPNLGFMGGEEEPPVDVRGNYFWGSPEFTMFNYKVCPEEGQEDPDSGDDEYLAALNCLGKSATCNMKQQRSAAACKLFCGTSKKNGPCSGHGVCVPAGGGEFKCRCASGYKSVQGKPHECAKA
ncbi:unnamed protein product [Closterium sp. NIES-53]